MPTADIPHSVQLDTAMARALRVAGWQLLASAGAFLLALVCTAVGQLVSGVTQAEDDAAARLGTNPDQLPIEVLADIHRDDGWLPTLLVALPFVAAAVLLLLGVRTAVWTAASRRRGIEVVAVALATISALTWGYVQVASPLYVEPLQQFVFPAVVASTAAGCAAIVAVVVVLRARGIARRTGLAVAALGSASTLGAFTVVPPFAPYLLALVLALALVRAHASPTM